MTDSPLLPRRTIIGAARVAGVGLFTGKPCELRCVPAPAGAGISFVRVDLAGAPVIPATVHSLGAAPPGALGAVLPGGVRGEVLRARNTTLRVGDAECMTVEHVMSALVGLGITDVV